MKACKWIAWTTTTVLVLTAGLPLTHTAAAKTATDNPADIHAMIRDYRKTAAELEEIRRSTVQTDPELKARYERFQDKLQNAMLKAGYNVESNRARLKAIGKQLRSTTITGDERHKLAGELLRIRQKRDRARAKALQMPDIQAANRELRQITLAAMKERNNEAKTMIKFMNALHDKLQSMKKNNRDADGPNDDASN